MHVSDVLALRKGQIVAYRVAYVYVRSVRDLSHSRIQVDDIAWGLGGVQMRVESLQESSLARAGHACGVI